MIMAQLAEDLRNEAGELQALLVKLSEDDWKRSTPFKDWTPENVIRHLMFGDWMANLSISDPEQFAEFQSRRTSEREKGGDDISIKFRQQSVAPGVDLIEQWHDGLLNLCNLFASRDPRERVQWVGPEMSIRSSATARLMETWAHARDIYDLMKVPRIETDRIRNIAALGVNTFSWSFANRGHKAPEAPPFIVLTAPSGDIWQWNDPSETNCIKGPALDFVSVVTQIRNIADVDLTLIGETAKQWMAIAQCFAGKPETPPPAGTRT